MNDLGLRLLCIAVPGSGLGSGLGSGSSPGSRGFRRIGDARHVASDATTRIRPIPAPDHPEAPPPASVPDSHRPSTTKTMRNSGH